MNVEWTTTSWSGRLVIIARITERTWTAQAVTKQHKTSVVGAARERRRGNSGDVRLARPSEGCGGLQIVGGSGVGGSTASCHPSSVVWVTVPRITKVSTGV